MLSIGWFDAASSSSPREQVLFDLVSGFSPLAGSAYASSCSAAANRLALLMRVTDFGGTLRSYCRSISIEPLSRARTARRRIPPASEMASGHSMVCYRQLRRVAVDVPDS